MSRRTDGTGEAVDFLARSLLVAGLFGRGPFSFLMGKKERRGSPFSSTWPLMLEQSISILS